MLDRYVSYLINNLGITHHHLEWSLGNPKKLEKMPLTLNPTLFYFYSYEKEP